MVLLFCLYACNTIKVFLLLLWNNNQNGGPTPITVMVVIEFIGNNTDTDTDTNTHYREYYSFGSGWNRRCMNELRLFSRINPKYQSVRDVNNSNSNSSKIQIINRSWSLEYYSIRQHYTSHANTNTNTESSKNVFLQNGFVCSQINHD